MTGQNLISQSTPRYGFNVYRSGVLLREQIVPAATSAIAELKVWRYLDVDEYVWYAEPRLIDPVSDGVTFGPLSQYRTFDIIVYNDEEDAA